MTLRHLHIFAAVYEEASFTRAGQRLHLAQPAVSLAVRELEEHCGAPLFDRVRRIVRPTAQGEYLYGCALRIFSMLEEMEAGLHGGQGGALRLGSSVTIGSELLPALLVRYRALYPQVQTHVTVGNYRAIEEAILKNQIDFGLIETEPDLPQLTAIPFLEDELVAVAAPDFPLPQRGGGAADALPLSALAGVPFLAREPGSSIRALVESAFYMEQEPFHPAWESASPQALLAAAEQGLGVAALPRRLAAAALQKGRLVALPIPALRIRRRYNIVYYEQKYLPPYMRDFFALCAESAGKKEDGGAAEAPFQK